MFKTLYIFLVLFFIPISAYSEKPTPFDAGLTPFLWGDSYAARYCPSVCSDMVWKEGTFANGASGESNTCGVYSTDKGAHGNVYTIKVGDAPQSYCEANKPVDGMHWTTNWFCYGSSPNDCVCNCQPPDYSLGSQCFAAKKAGDISECISANESFYGVTSATMSWQGAQTLANKYNGNLVKIDNVGENQFILTNLAATHDVWIGLNDLGTANTWLWVNGQSAPSYLNWGEGEPNNRGSENCAILFGSVGRPQGTAGNWNNLSCGSSNSGSSFTGVIEWN